MLGLTFIYKLKIIFWVTFLFLGTCTCTKTESYINDINLYSLKCNDFLVADIKNIYHCQNNICSIFEKVDRDALFSSVVWHVLYVTPRIFVNFMLPLSSCRAGCAIRPRQIINVF